MKKLTSAALALFFLGACATTNGAAPGNTVTVTALPPLSIGIVSYGGSANADEDAKALHLYLSQKLGREVTPKVFVSESELSTAVATGQVDLAWMPPFSFVDAQGKGQVTPVVKVVRHGLPFYRGVLFVKAGSPVKTLKDLQDLNVAWVEKNSAAGYLFPRAAIVQAGLKPAELFKKETFLGDHSAVCHAVLDGTADVGATYADDRGNDPMQIDGCVQSAGDAAKSLRIISVTAPIPNDVIAARPGLSPSDIKRVASMFMGLGQGSDDPKLLAVFKAESFLEVGESDFEPVRFAADASGK